MDIRRVETIPFEQATVAEVLESGDPLAAEFYIRSEPLVRGVFPFIGYDEYLAMTTKRHRRYARVAVQANPNLAGFCEISREDLNLDSEGSGGDE